MLTIYKASAGSGKTFTLAYEYIKTLLAVKIHTATGEERWRLATEADGRRRHRHILAITFTNKATDEMKQRIIDELGAIGTTAAGPKPSEYSKRLMKLTGCAPEDLAAAATRALDSLLYDFHYFNVSTIDSFFQTVLRAFAREVDRPEDFEVEIEDKVVVSLAVDRMLSTVNDESSPEARSLEHWLRTFIHKHIDQGKKFNFFNRRGSLHSEMVDFIKRMCSEEFKMHFEAVNEYLTDISRLKRYQEALMANIGRWKKVIAEKCRLALEAIANEGLEEKVYNRAIMGRLKKWRNEAPNSDDIEDTDILKDCVKTPQEANIFYKSHFKKTSPPEHLRPIITGAVSTAYELADKIKVYDIIAQDLFHLGLMGYAFRAIEEIRKENNMIMLSDTNDLISRVVADDDAPFVYERIGMQLNHFLIDEFQDTSRMQWSNLKPLVDNSMSLGHSNLIIGDEKQCIYRFRNSDPSLLHTTIGRQFAGQTSVKGTVPEENTNYRSAPEVIRFNNTLFKLMAREMKVDTYSNVVQSVSDKHSSHHGYVKAVEFKSGKKSEYFDSLMASMEADIRSQLERGYRLRDIAVLVRKRKEAADIIDWLMRRCPDLEVKSDDSMPLASAPVVKLIVSVLRMIEDAGVRNGKHLSTREIRMRLNQIDYFMATKGLDASTALESIASDTYSHPEVLERIMECRPGNLISLVERVIDMAVSEESKRVDRTYLLAFQDCVAEYCARYTPGLHEFLQWWDTHSSGLRVAATAHRDAITIITIHSSKGLQYPCVHLPMVSWNLINKKQSTYWFEGPMIEGVDAEDVPPIVSVKHTSALKGEGSPLQSQYLVLEQEINTDNLNLAYVAFTRAESELCCYVSGGQETIGPYVVKALRTNESTSDPLLLNPGDYFTSNPDTSDDETGLKITGLLEVGAPSKPWGAAEEEPAAMYPYSPQAYRPEFPAPVSEMTTLLSGDGNEWAEEMDTDDEVEESPLPGGMTNRQWGLLLHDALSYIETPEWLERVIARIVHDKRLDAASAAYLRMKLEEAVLNPDPRVRAWMDDYRMLIAERPVFDPRSGETFRPDRVVWTADGHVDVVDYKFGRPHTRSHERQVAHYMELLRTMGHEHVRGFIYYPASGKIHPVE